MNAPKLGSPADRAVCARFASAQRAKFNSGGVNKSWTRREWYQQIEIDVNNRLARLTAEAKTTRAREYYTLTRSLG
jgi:hypothetical protein